jgi:transcriptional regulator with XRE-family HTH domain
MIRACSGYGDEVDEEPSAWELRRDFGQRIARLRRERGFSQTRLAKRLGVTRQRISRWESASHVPPIELLVRLSELLAVTLDELIAGRLPAVVDPARLTPMQREVLAGAVDALSRLLRPAAPRTGRGFGADAPRRCRVLKHDRATTPGRI